MADSQIRASADRSAVGSPLDFPRFLASPVVHEGRLRGFRLWISSRRCWPRRLYVQARGVENETLPPTGSCFIADRHVLIQTSGLWITMTIEPELENYDHEYRRT